VGQNTLKGAKKALDLKNCNKYLDFIYFLPFETMVIMAFFFITHMNVKKLKLKIHLIQILGFNLVYNFWKWKLLSFKKNKIKGLSKDSYNKNKLMVEKI